LGRPILLRKHNKAPNGDRRPRKRSRAIAQRNRDSGRVHDSKESGQGRTKSKRQLNRIALAGPEQPGRDVQIRVVRSRHHARGVNFLTSSRWIDTLKCPGTAVDLPFIDQYGKFTGTNVYRANLSPQGYLSVVISTIFRRIFFWSRRNNEIHQCNVRQSLLLKCAGYYALSKNSYFWDRVLALSKDLRANYRTITRLLHRYSHKLDAHKWFVYGHVCLQTQWLTSRAVRPRDKSAFKTSEENFTLPSSIRGRKNDILRFEFDAVWSCFATVSQMCHVP
jgi:hypothetical protein